MLVSWKWLKELVEINITPEELAEKMTMSGVAVEGIEYLGEGIEGVRVGLIESVRVHPEADKLVVCSVKVGDESLTIVTGAPNVKVGQKIPVACPGSVLPGGKRIETAVFRGIESQGMLCSAGEMGLDEEKLSAEMKDGIYILSSDAPIGQSIIEVLNLDDVILELELTPNRSDCLSMINVAREVSGLTGGKVKIPEIPESKVGGPCGELTRVDIVDDQLCRRYTARIIKEVHIAESPLWLQHRLLAAGVRPINNIVDITNYVMLETGQPLHAFDYDRLKEHRIVVRKAEQGEKLVTLDGQERQLKPDMLIIADAEKPVGIAGVMGGLETEVTEKTDTILLESAFFHGTSIRRTSQALGLRSEASLRFEKNVDLDQVALAADRALQLISELGAGKPVEGRVDTYPAPLDKKPIMLRLTRVNSILGTNIKKDIIEKILVSLNIDILEGSEEKWLVAPPSYRGDLEREIDLIEEVARLYGYDNIPTTLPYGATIQGRRTSQQDLRVKLGDLMVAQGFHGVITYSFVNPKHLDWLRLPEGHPLRDVVSVKNPLSEEQGIMRTTLLPGLLDTVMRNINKRNKNLKFFELGKIYNAGRFPEDRELPEERTVLLSVVTGQREKNWSQNAEEYDFFHLKGVLENVLHNTGVAEWNFTPGHDIPYMHPGRTAHLDINGISAGFMGEVNPLVLDKYGIDQRVSVFSLDFQTLVEQRIENVTYSPIPKYPAVSRDLALTVPEKVEAQDLIKIITSEGKNLLQEVRLFDLYRGKQIAQGYKSLAFSLTWQAEDKTLTDEEVNGLHINIEEALNKELGADVRRS